MVPPVQVQPWLPGVQAVPWLVKQHSYPPEQSDALPPTDAAYAWHASRASASLSVPSGLQS